MPTLMDWAFAVEKVRVGWRGALGDWLRTQRLTNTNDGITKKRQKRGAGIWRVYSCLNV